MQKERGDVAEEWGGLLGRQESESGPAVNPVTCRAEGPLQEEGGPRPWDRASDSTPGSSPRPPGSWSGAIPCGTERKEKNHLSPQFLSWPGGRGRFTSNTDKRAGASRAGYPSFAPPCRLTRGGNPQSRQPGLTVSLLSVARATCLKGESGAGTRCAGLSSALHLPLSCRSQTLCCWPGSVHSGPGPGSFSGDFCVLSLRREADPSGLIGASG